MIKKTNGSQKSRCVSTSLFFIIVILYLLILLYLPKNGFWINDNGFKLIQLNGLIHGGLWEFNIPWPGESIDSQRLFNPLPYPYTQIVDGRLSGFYPYPFIILSYIPYRFFNTTGLYLIPFISFLFMIRGVFLLAMDVIQRSSCPNLSGKNGQNDDAIHGQFSTQPLPRRACQSESRQNIALLGNSELHSPRLAVLLTAFCTPILFYTMTFWEHLPATAFVVWSALFYLRFYQQKHDLKNLVFSAICSGVAIYFRDSLYVFSAAQTALLLASNIKKAHNVLIWIIALCMTLFPLWVFNQIFFNHPLGLHAGYVSLFQDGLSGYLVDRIKVFNVLLLNGHPNRLISITATIPFIICLYLYPLIRVRRYEWLIGLISISGLYAAVSIGSGFLFSNQPVYDLIQSNGLFAASPFLIVSFFRWEDENDIKMHLWRLIAIHTALYLFISPYTNTYGIHWGCRLLLSLYPLLAVLAADNFVLLGTSEKFSLPGKWMCSILIGFSLLFQLYALYLLNNNKLSSSYLNKIVSEAPEEHVMTFDWFVPQLIGHCFYNKKIFLVKNEKELRELLDLLRQKDIDRVQLISSRPININIPSEKKSYKDKLNFLNFEQYRIQIQ